MYKIKKIWGLLAFLSGLVITLLGIVYVGQLGVVAMILGEHIAYTYAYPIISVVVQVLSYIAVLAILYLMGWGIVNYVKNRSKPDEPSSEVEAINTLSRELTSVISTLTKEIRQDRDERNNPKL